MTRTTLHRIQNWVGQAAYNVGDDLPNQPLHHRETSRKMSRLLESKGEIKSTPKSRAYALWHKIRTGAIKGKVVVSIMRDHAKEFASFDKQAAMLNGKLAV